MCLSRISAVSQTDGLNAHEFLKAHHHQTGPGRNRFPSLLGGQKISGRENPENTLNRRRRRPSRPPAEGARGTPPPSLRFQPEQEAERTRRHTLIRGIPPSRPPLPQPPPLGGAQIPRPRRDPSPLFLW